MLVFSVVDYVRTSLDIQYNYVTTDTLLLLCAFSNYGIICLYGDTKTYNVLICCMAIRISITMSSVMQTTEKKNLFCGL